MRDRNRIQDRRGFTLVEFFVVVAVTVFLSSYLILYNSVSRRQVTLYIEQSKVAQAVLRSKSLAISTLFDPSGPPAKPTPCGYGLRFDYAAKTYSLFSYRISSCQDLTFIDSTNSVPGRDYISLETFSLGEGLAFKNCPDGAAEPNKLEHVFFMPPDPRTLIWEVGNSVPLPGGAGSVYLATVDCSANTIVTVSSAGQVSF